MAVNSSQIDLNADAVLFDRENEVLGFNTSRSNVNVGVSRSETLISDPVGGGGGGDQKDCIVGDDEGTNGSVELFSVPVMVGFHMSPGCDDVMIDGSRKEGFCEERMNGLEAGVLDVVDGGCDGKAGEFSCGLVKNEDMKSGIQYSDGVPYVYGGAEPDKGLVFESNDEVQIELGCENAGKGASSNEAQGVDDNLTECRQVVKNIAFVNFSAVVEDDSMMKAADCFVTRDDLVDTKYDLEDMHVDADESLHMKDLFSRSCPELETSHELKQPAFQTDAQANVIMNQTTDINIDGAGLSENTGHHCRGFNLVVDLNCYRNTQENGMYRESVFSEVNFCVSDLVWAKVRGHPWWPGQICDPSAASEKAKRHLKENCYLIAYFGDQTFAWNDVSMIKPFQMHFSQMKKQSNLENFQYAVDCALEEVSRRVEFGLSCPCKPEDAFSKIKTQVIANAGILKQSSRRNGGDRFINATSFEAVKLVNFVRSLAQSPLVEFDRLDLIIARAQLLAFYRSKGYSQLPEFTVLDRLFKNDMETHLGFSQTSSNHISRIGKQPGRIGKQPGKKLKLLSDLMSEKNFCIPNGERTLKRKAGDKSNSRRSGRKRKATYNTSDDYFHNPQIRKLTQLQNVSIDEMWSQLCLAAKDPAEESCFSDMVYFFAEFRKFVGLNDSASSEQGMSLEQMHGGDGETGVTSIEAVASTPTAMELCNDSYWTDRIIESISEEQSSFENQNEREEFMPEIPTEANSSSFKSQPAAAEISINLGFLQQDTDRNLGSEPPNLAEQLDESSPTALTLKFTNLDSVPSTTDLNEIFGRFGPLMESKTELLKKTNRARVVFKRRSDAETAFSSAGKYSIFGPSLVSYRLKILPRSPKQGTGKRGRPRKKETSSVDGAAV